MAENPLLPNARLKELFALMQRARAMSKAPASAPRFEAILSATLMHVEPGDFVSPPPGAKHAALLAAERSTAPSRRKSAIVSTTLEALPDQQRLAISAGIAQGMKIAKTNRLALFYTDANSRSEQGWAEALTYATRAHLPLLMVVADIPGRSGIANSRIISWLAMSKLAKRLRLPVLTVDGSDAVAVYRAMQESAHRARQGDGVAVIWCVLPSRREKPAVADPIANMRRYLKARGLPTA